MELSQKRFNELITLQADYNLALQLGGMSPEETERTQLLLHDINAALEAYGFGAPEN